MPRITEEQWVDYYHFLRFPFDRPEAGNEEFSRPDFLASCFVEPEKFDRFMGQADNPVSGFLFAARGTGKTACRVMIDYYCKVGAIPSKSHKEQNSFVLSVPHIYLNNVVDMSRDANGEIRILAKNHAVEILQRAVPAFVELIAKMPEGIVNVQKLQDGDKTDLAWLIANYSNNLSSTQANFIKLIGLDIFSRREPIIGVSHLSESKKTSRQSSLAQYRLSRQAQNSPLDHLKDWASLIHKVGIDSTYVLVDGTDEIEETASDADFAYRLLQPLTTNLRFMDGIPYLAMKYFLPDFVKPKLFADNKFRKDRNFIIETIEWDEQQLITILRKRLSALRPQEQRISDTFAGGSVVSLDSLCVPELRGWVELELAKKSLGNPRSLFLLCGTMVTAHCNRDISNQDDPYELNKDDFNTALETFENYFEPKGKVLSLNSTPDIHALIDRGESDLVEFKSSIRWDFRQNQINKELQAVIAKTIAGMVNQKGGVLLIGVKDDGTILGLEYDIQTLASKNTDGFYRAVLDILKIYIEFPTVVLGSIDIQFVSILDKDICAIFMQKAPEPVFIKSGETTEFWVRQGNATKYIGARETVNYINREWPSKANG